MPMSSSGSDDDTSAVHNSSRARDGSSSAATLTATSSMFASSTSNVIGINAASKQKSLFAGMGRVRHINHLREKWSGKLKVVAPPTRGSDAGASAPMSPLSNAVSLRKAKKLHASIAVPASSESESGREALDRDAKRRRTIAMVDMERYRTLFAWLESNGIEIPQPHLHHAAYRRQSRAGQTAAATAVLTTTAAHSALDRTRLFDDVYDSLEQLEQAVESEISELPTQRPVLAPHNKHRASTKASASSKTAPSLVDYLVVIGPDVTDIAMQSYWHSEAGTFEATVAFAWPPESQFNAESIEHFCFPSGVVAARRTDKQQQESPSGRDAHSADNFFVLVLAGGGAQGQSVQYAACMKGAITLPGTSDTAVSTTVPVCYCLISTLPFIPFFQELLTRLLDDHRSDLELEHDLSAMGCVLSNRHAHKLDDVLQRLQRVALPRPGAAASVQLFATCDPPMQLVRPRAEPGADETATLLLQWSLPHVLARLSVAHMLRLVALLLLEMKVVVVSTSLTLLSSATLAIASLLHPLQWPGPLITVLPPFLHEYLEAPVPLICGVDHLSSAFEVARGTVVLDLERNSLVLHDADARDFAAAPTLPGFAALAHALDALTQQLRSGGDGSANSSAGRTRFAVDAVIRRVRSHIAQLVAMCVATSDSSDDPCSSLSGSAGTGTGSPDLLRMFMRSQMFQRYQDDHATDGSSNTVLPSVELPKPVAAASAPAVTQVSTESRPLCDWRDAAGVLFRVAVTGINVTRSAGADDNKLIDVTTDALNETPESDCVYTDCSADGAAALRTNSSPSMRSTPSGSPVISTRQLCDRGDNDDDVALAAVQHSRPTETRSLSHSNSSSSVYKRSRSGGLDAVAVNDVLNLMIDPTLSALAYDEPTDSPAGDGDTSWFSDASSVVDDDDSGQGNESFDDAESSTAAQNGSQHSTDASDEAGTDTKRLGAHSDAVASRLAHLAHVASSRRIQRSWRRWRCTQRQQQQVVATNATTLSPIALSAQTTSVAMQKRGNNGEWTDCRVWLSSDTSSLSWRSFANGRRCLVSTLALVDITFAAFQAAGLDAPRTGDFATLELACESKRRCFRYERTPELLDFAAALFHALRTVAVVQTDIAVAGTAGAAAAAPLDVRAFEPPARVSDVQPLAAGSNSSSNNNSATRITPTSDVEQFRLRLHDGFVVEKHGRMGKPHLRLLYMDRLCSRLMWKKPPPLPAAAAAALPTTSSYEQLAGSRRHRTSSSAAITSSRSSSSAFFQKALLLSTVTAVVEGKQTRVFQRAAARASDNALCFSVVTPTRTLDVCALSQSDYDALVSGLRALVLSQQPGVATHVVDE